MRKIIFVLISFIALFVLTQSSVFACGCFYLPQTLEQSLNERLKNNTTIFSGEIIGLKISPITEDFIIGKQKGQVELVKIRVKESWKSFLPQEITIKTWQNDCGYRFQIGKSYLIFAYGAKNNYKTGNCSENTELEKAGKVLTILGKGMKPKK